MRALFKSYLILFLLLITAKIQALEVGIHVGMFGPLIPFSPFIEASVTFGERGQDYRQELGIRYKPPGSFGLGVVEMINRSWIHSAPLEPSSFGKRFSFAVEYSPYLVLEKHNPWVYNSDGSIATDKEGHPIKGAAELDAWFAGLNLKACLSLFLGEDPQDLFHELFLSDGIYVGLFDFYDMSFTLSPVGDGNDCILYCPIWLSIGYGGGFDL